VTNRPARPLAWRLSLTIVAVAVAVVGLFAGLMFLITRSDINGLEAQRTQDIEISLTSASLLAYRTAGGWEGANMRPVVDLAREVNARVQVDNVYGKVIVTGGAGIDGPTEPANLLSITDGDTTVGNLLLTFPRPDVPSDISILRGRLGVAALLVGVLSVLLGVAVAIVVARRLTRPIAELTAAVHAVNEGDTDVRVGALSSPLELQDLGAGFNDMAATLERQDRLRKSLVADVAHELRTPLSVLQASCEAMVDGVATPSRELANSMLQQVHRLGQRIADLDALTSAESAGLRLVRSPVDLDEVAQEVAESVRPRFADEGISLSTSLAPATVLGDRDRLNQVMTNLLVNAAKFTPTGGAVRISVSQDGDQAVTEVSDSGIGIESTELPHVFDRFWRGAGSVGTPGSGVGLAIVSELVRAHRGTVTVRSDVGRGTNFVVRLPLG
jgi:two-component system, OmpR family, sensor histidine kinase BaeS